MPCRLMPGTFIDKPMGFRHVDEAVSRRPTDTTMIPRRTDSVDYVPTLLGPALDPVL